MTALQPVSEPGRRAVAACREVALTLQQLAIDADRSGRMSEQSFAALREAGILAVFVPESLGGMGLSSAHDWVQVVSAPFRGSGTNHHLASSHGS